MDDIHSCSYWCERPACILRQRDELRELLPDAINYAKENPAGGVARMFEVMAQRIRAGESFDEVLKDYDLARLAPSRD